MSTEFLRDPCIVWEYFSQGGWECSPATGPKVTMYGLSLGETDDEEACVAQHLAFECCRWVCLYSFSVPLKIIHVFFQLANNMWMKWMDLCQDFSANSGWIPWHKAQRLRGQFSNKSGFGRHLQVLWIERARTVRGGGGRIRNSEKIHITIIPYLSGLSACLSTYLLSLYTSTNNALVMCIAFNLWVSSLCFACLWSLTISGSFCLLPVPHSLLWDSGQGQL